MTRFILGSLLTIILFSVGAVLAGIGLDSSNAAVTAGMVFLGGCLMLYTVANLIYNVVKLRLIKLQYRAQQERKEIAEKMRGMVREIEDGMQEAQAKAKAAVRAQSDPVADLLHRASKGNDELH